jgi:hypothetical protein
MALDEPRSRDVRHCVDGVIFVLSPMDAHRVGDFAVEVLGGALVARQVVHAER